MGRFLVKIAWSTLESDLLGKSTDLPQGQWLQEQRACFVTLHRSGELRGCVGSMLAYRPLFEDIQDNTRAAAFRDPRFPAVSASEIESLSLEVSLLSPLESVIFHSESDLISQLRPGVDGLLLEHGYHRGTFLPAVWASLSEPALFWSRLKTKAGIPKDFWSPEFKVQRYTTRTWSDADWHR